MQPRKLSNPREGPYSIMQVHNQDNTIQVNRNSAKKYFSIVSDLIFSVILVSLGIKIIFKVC